MGSHLGVGGGEASKSVSDPYPAPSTYQLCFCQRRPFTRVSGERGYSTPSWCLLRRHTERSAWWLFLLKYVIFKSGLSPTQFRHQEESYFKRCLEIMAPVSASPSLGSEKSLRTLRLADEDREKKERGERQYHQM